MTLAHCAHMQIDLPERFVVFDLEWTAWEGSRERAWSGPDEYREIYDIGAVVVEGGEFAVGETYRQLVTLEMVPTLPAYSTQLTSITQQEINQQGVSFANMVAAFDSLVEDLALYCWGVDGEIWAENCQLKNVADPFAKNRFHNMKDTFISAGVPADEYFSSTIVTYFGKENVHTAHQGLDDALNIVEALRLLKDEKTWTNPGSVSGRENVPTSPRQ